MPQQRASTIQRLLHPKAKVNFHEEYLPDPDSDTFTSFHLNLDEQAQDNYRKLQDHERKAMATAKAENATYNNKSGVYLLNLRALGLFYIMVHADFCRRSLQDVPITLLTAEIKHALNQADPFDAELLFELGETIRWLMTMWRTHPPGGTPQPSHSLSRVEVMVDETKRQSVLAWIEGSKSPAESVKNTALARDGFKCVASGRWEEAYTKLIDPAAKGPAEPTECCHIVPQSILAVPPPDDPTRDEPRVQEKLIKTGNMLAILELFGLHAQAATLKAENGAHDLSNILTMIHSTHLKFDKLEFWFEQTNVPNQYQLAADVDIGDRLLIPQTIVTFADHSPEYDLPEAPLPSPQLLALHAVCARVAHMSGAAEYFDFCDRKREFAPQLEADGSMAMVLEEALRTVIFAY